MEIEPGTSYLHRKRGGDFTVDSIATAMVDGLEVPTVRIVVFHDNNGAGDNMHYCSEAAFQLDYAEIED